MADIDENLVTVLAADDTVSAITTNIDINATPESDSIPFIWIQQIDEEDVGRDLDSGGLPIFTFVVECVSTSLSESKDLKAAAQAELDNKTGSFGDQNIAWAEVSAVDDTYENRNPYGDNGDLHVSAFIVEIGVDGR